MTNILSFTSLFLNFQAAEVSALYFSLRFLFQQQVLFSVIAFLWSVEIFNKKYNFDLALGSPFLRNLVSSVS